MNEARRRVTALNVAAVLVTAASITLAAPAAADGANVGADCRPDQIGVAATANDGTAIRCTVDERGAIHWLPDTAVVSTIAALQAQGFTLTVDRAGDHPLESCSVVEVHNPLITTERIGSGGTTPGGPGSSGDRHATTIVVTKKIDVSLDCTKG